MRRATALVSFGIVLAVVAVSLGGCVPRLPGLNPLAWLPRTPAAAPPVKVGEPTVGTHTLQTFIPMTAVTFSDGMASIGEQNAESGKVTIPAVLRPEGGEAWNVERVGSIYRFVSGAAELGSTRIVVGTTPTSEVPGKDEMPWVGVSDNGGAYRVEELGKSVFGGRSAELRGISSTGNTLDPDSVFMAVGGVERAAGYLVGNPSGTDPFAIVSEDGRTWTQTASLPLPDGVNGAEAWAVTYAPSGTAHPGTIVVGTGWADAGPGNILGRKVGIVWHTADAGKTWDIISDDNFFFPGRDFSPSLVAADDSTIVVAGWADAQGQIGSKVDQKQAESIEWYIGADGVWHIISDGKSLRATRSSLTTALVARKAGGFIEASEIYDTATGSYAPGAAQKGSPVVRLFSSPDAANWTLIDDSVPGIEKGAVVDGIAEYANRDAFFGIDNTTHSMAWVVDRASIK